MPLHDVLPCWSQYRSNSNLLVFVYAKKSETFGIMKYNIYLLELYLSILWATSGHKFTGIGGHRWK